MVSKGLGCNMNQTLWTLAFVLALVKTKLDLFHGGTERDGELITRGHPSVSTQINLITPQPPMHGPVKCFSRDPVEEPHSHPQYSHNMNVLEVF